MSEVSLGWCEMVKVKIVDKVKLRCGKFFGRTEQNKDEIYEAILKSHRQHKHMEIDWLDSPKSFDVIEKFSSTLEDLEINSENWNLSKQFSFKFVAFPRLKRLKVMPVVAEKWIVRCLWASNCQLNELKICAHHENNSSTYRDTLRFILRQHQLKRLEFVEQDDPDEDDFEELEITLFISEIGNENVGLRLVEHFKYSSTSIRITLWHFPRSCRICVNLKLSM
jgi:hypothetical protein